MKKKWVFDLSYRFALLVLISSCDLSDKDFCKELPAEMKLPDVKVFRMDEALGKAGSTQEIQKLFAENRVFADQFLDTKEYPHDSILAEKLTNLLKQPSLDTLYMECKNEFGDLTELANQFSNAYGWLKYYYPDASIPKIYTVITGFYNDVFISDSVVVIGLDYFLGEGAKYRPLNIPHYILRRYEKEGILPLIMAFVSNSYNKVRSDDNSLLGEMIDYGKSYYFSQMILPCTPQHMIIGFTEEELIKVERNQEVIWAHFISKELLYETNHTLKNKYVGERPNVYEIGDECPGRIGRWIGWKIVEAYMEKNQNVTFQELMEETDVQKIFTRSKFKAKDKTT